jgi:hypothetical protein
MTGFERKTEPRALLQDFGPIPLPFTPVARPKVKGNGGLFRVPYWLHPVISEYSRTQYRRNPMISEIYPFLNNGSFRWNWNIPTFNTGGPRWCRSFIPFSISANSGDVRPPFVDLVTLTYQINSIENFFKYSILTNILTHNYLSRAGTNKTWSLNCC